MVPTPDSARPLCIAIVAPDADAQADELARSLERAGLRLVGPGAAAGVDVTLVVGEAHDVREVAASGAGRVVAVVDAADRRVASAMLEAGASGVVVAADGDALVQGVLAVAAGFVVVPEAARDAVRRPVLTARKRQILSLLVLGLSNADIAGRLFVSEATVKSHLTEIFATLGVSSRKEAIDLILDPGSGLGTGILGIAAADRTQTGYGSPSISS